MHTTHGDTGGCACCETVWIADFMSPTVSSLFPWLSASSLIDQSSSKGRNWEGKLAPVKHLYAVAAVPHGVTLLGLTGSAGWAAGAEETVASSERKARIG